MAIEPWPIVVLAIEPMIWGLVLWSFCLWWWSSGHQFCDYDDLVVEIGPCAAYALVVLYMGLETYLGSWHATV